MNAGYTSVFDAIRNGIAPVAANSAKLDLQLTKLNSGSQNGPSNNYSYA